jgi:RNA polymerase sigma-70 factor (ECF subfamily)
VSADWQPTLPDRKLPHSSISSCFYLGLPAVLFLIHEKKSDLLTTAEISYHVEACSRNSRESQKLIYTSFYSYAMTICERYTNSYEDAIETLNDGFLKIFKEIHRYKPAYTDEASSFKGWLRKIMVNTAIDHFRRNQKYRFTKELDNIQLPSSNENAIDKISYEEIMQSIQLLTPAYRTVLSLFIVEGFTHEEIARKLGISIGTSKSNLANARRQLQKILSTQNDIFLTTNRNISLNFSK